MVFLKCYCTHCTVDSEPPIGTCSGRLCRPGSYIPIYIYCISIGNLTIWPRGPSFAFRDEGEEKGGTFDMLGRMSSKYCKKVQYYLYEQNISSFEFVTPFSFIILWQIFYSRRRRWGDALLKARSQRLIFCPIGWITQKAAATFKIYEEKVHNWNIV